MKLLAKSDVNRAKKKENDALIDLNLRLKRAVKEETIRLNSLKEGYEPDKLKKLEEFERFCEEIKQKKSKLLAELSEIEKRIEMNKEIYYGLIEKKDELIEKEYEFVNREAKLKLREDFVTRLEERQQQLARA